MKQQEEGTHDIRPTAREGKSMHVIVRTERFLVPLRGIPASTAGNN